MDINQVLILAGSSDDDDLTTQLNKIAAWYTNIINQAPPLQMENYKWKIEYVNDGEFTKYSKVDGEKEISHIIINNSSGKSVMSDENDKDLKKIKSFMEIGYLMRG